MHDSDFESPQVSGVVSTSSSDASDASPITEHDSQDDGIPPDEAMHLYIMHIITHKRCDIEEYPELAALFRRLYCDEFDVVIKSSVFAYPFTIPEFMKFARSINKTISCDVGKVANKSGVERVDALAAFMFRLFSEYSKHENEFRDVNFIPLGMREIDCAIIFACKRCESVSSLREYLRGGYNIDIDDVLVDEGGDNSNVVFSKRLRNGTGHANARCIEVAAMLGNVPLFDSLYDKGYANSCDRFELAYFASCGGVLINYIKSVSQDIRAEDRDSFFKQCITCASVFHQLPIIYKITDYSSDPSLIDYAGQQLLKYHRCHCIYGNRRHRILTNSPSYLINNIIQ